MQQAARKRNRMALNALEVLKSVEETFPKFKGQMSFQVGGIVIWDKDGTRLGTITRDSHNRRIFTPEQRALKLHAAYYQ